MVRPRYTNEIQTTFAGCLRKALSEYFGVTEAQCPVIYTGQPIPQTAHRCVTYSKLNGHRLGFQGRHLVTDNQEDTGFAEIENWVEEMQFQVNARTKETVSDTHNTVVARDIADGLISWFNSGSGGDYMRSVKVYPLRVSDIRNLTSSDESELLQNTASFDITIHIGQCKQMREIDSQTGRMKIVRIPIEETGESGESE